MNVQVLGAGHALPSRVLTNKELEKMVDTTHEWIVERSGILERRIIDEDKAASDLGFEAARMALDEAGVEPEELDLIIVATATPDMLFPATACIIQERLEAWNAAAFDLEAGCTGFVYALTVAEKFLLSQQYKYALVIGTEALSRIVDYTDRNTCVLFGDGAGAVVLGKGNNGFGIICTYLGADGRGGKYLKVPAGGSALPANPQTVKERLHFIKMNGNEIFKFATRITVEVSEKLFAMSGLGYKDIDFFIPHQANIRIIKTAMKRMNIPPEKTLINLDVFGNTSAACIPIALSMSNQEGRLHDGALILMVAFGAGLTYGGALLRWGRD